MRRARAAPHITDTGSAPRPEVAAAREEGLRYTTDHEPGLRRVVRGKGFVYLDSEGRQIRDTATLARIRSLAIPPAYRDVWICPYANGHLQATGRDARGRKQYRYHPRWRATRDATKFDRMLEFGAALPRIRRRVALDLRRPGLPREKVLAAIVRLLECTLIRVGNEEYARANGSFGLTTLRDRHVELNGGTVQLEFRGKSGIMQKVSIEDHHVARIVRDCRDIPGQELFQWIDGEGERRRIDSTDVNEYLREASGGPFTAKDYRTWFATLEALDYLRARSARTDRETRRLLVETAKHVAAKLGNTPTICRKCYIHPEVFAAFGSGKLAAIKGTAAAQVLRALLAPKRASKRTDNGSSRSNPTRRVAITHRARAQSPTAARSLSG
jgi:DNA topoisomerase-1